MLHHPFLQQQGRGRVDDGFIEPFPGIQVHAFVGRRQGHADPAVFPELQHAVVIGEMRQQLDRGGHHEIGAEAELLPGLVRHIQLAEIRRDEAAQAGVGLGESRGQLLGGKVKLQQFGAVGAVRIQRTDDPGQQRLIHLGIHALGRGRIAE